ncbi:hypothetical protein [Xanthovirga aplysinae]|uniref:hypothetical protein n=1 Tax=Xanthovirga aplysinae TaxID=2529853 RepID=UPI0012BD2709|nr:hypothetical protein [Xanthovirga aplysinae]
MDYNKRLIEVYLELKKKGEITTLKDFGWVMSENANGISDIKFERKSVTLTHLEMLKERFNEVNIERIVTGEGPILLIPTENIQPEKIEKDDERITQLETELSKANLQVEHLESIIKSKDETLKAREQMIELMNRLVKSPTSN